VLLGGTQPIEIQVIVMGDRQSALDTLAEASRCGPPEVKRIGGWSPSPAEGAVAVAGALLPLTDAPSS